MSGAPPAPAAPAAEPRAPSAERAQLSAMCRRGTSANLTVVILRNLATLYDVGDMPYRLARPLLQQCRPEQLRMLEEASPRACLRDFADLRKLDEEGRLDAPPAWRDLYQTRQQQAEEAKALATARIKGRYAEHSAQKNAKKLIVTDVPIPTQRRRPPPAARTPATALQSQGRAMLLKARTGLAMRARQMMRPPRHRPATRPASTAPRKPTALPRPAAPHGRGGSAT